MAAEIVVETPSGCLRGSASRACADNSQFDEDEDDDDKCPNYLQFKGIPYARPPVGRLRFCDPVSIEPWQGIKEATVHGPVSPQMDPKTKNIVGSEDCLHLNVYTKKLDGKAPVLFWVHGGAFLYGSGDDVRYGPDYFMRKDVVLVTFNYRLGILGFLNVQDEVASGNQGLKDQVMALKWVNAHISCFGGDPGNVTIFGCSSGAASVHYLTLSPLAKDLFHKAICQSGNALCPWALKDEPLKSLRELTIGLGCKAKDPAGVVHFLRKMDYSKLIEAQEKLITPQRYLRCEFPFGPGLDPKSSKPFMPVNLADAIEEGVQVPLIIGNTDLEGKFLLDVFRSIDLGEMNVNLEKYLPTKSIDALQKRYGLNVQDLRQLYFNREDITRTKERKLLELYGDLTFVEGTHRLEKIQYGNSPAPTFLYKFSYDRSVEELMIDNGDRKELLNGIIEGASHAAEVLYLFRSRESKTTDADEGLHQGEKEDLSVAEKRIVRRMVELWTNFARIGRPTPFTSELIPIYWQPLLSDVVLRFLNIGEELRVEQELNIEQRYSFKRTKKQIERCTE